MTSTLDTALDFAALHQPGQPLLLPNAWDAASARIIEKAGAAAIATTSAAVAWSLGTLDGNRLNPDLAVAVIARIAETVTVPVSADIEGGYAECPAGVAATVLRVLAAGAVGVNIEDTNHFGDGLLSVDEQGARIGAARAAGAAVGLPVFINARIDTYVHAIDEPDVRWKQTAERANAYLAAGASGIFVPGLLDLDEIARLAATIDGPLNVMAGPGAPSVAELAKTGVARISVGGEIAAAAYAVARRAATELCVQGTYDALADRIDFPDFQAMMS